VLEDGLKVLVVTLGEIGRVADAVDAAESTEKKTRHYVVAQC
jgi:hypothetical protein